LKNERNIKKTALLLAMLFTRLARTFMCVSCAQWWEKTQRHYCRRASIQRCHRLLVARIINGIFREFCRRDKNKKNEPSTPIYCNQPPDDYITDNKIFCSLALSFFHSIESNSLTFTVVYRIYKYINCFFRLSIS
jgi:hypothetical protein